VRSADRPARTAIVISVIGLSWLGLVIHNLADLGGQVLLGPETVGPTAVYLLLATGWVTPARRAVGWLLLGWGLLNMVGGGLLSVLPVPLWLYQPEQSLRHYAFHAIYATLQAPLLITVARHIRHAPTRTPASTPVNASDKAVPPPPPGARAAFPHRVRPAATTDNAS
jgi:hypothetical protein